MATILHNYVYIRDINDNELRSELMSRNPGVDKIPVETAIEHMLNVIGIWNYNTTIRNYLLELLCVSDIGKQINGVELVKLLGLDL